jgi:hypothetical protein
MDWLRVRGPTSDAAAATTIAANRVYQIDHYQINEMWQTLPFVVEGQEIGHAYRPPTVPPVAEPYGSVKELVAELQDVLAPMELGLAVEYLYALFSLKSPQDLGAQGADGPYPTLADDLDSARRSLLDIAVSEMTHLRWVNQVLWEIHRAGNGPDGWTYRPVVTPGLVRETTGDLRRIQLRPLTPEVMDEFIRTERPKGDLLTAYARCIATFEKNAFPLPPRALELLKRIDGEGQAHYDRFLALRGSLAAYRQADGSLPYLRNVQPDRTTRTDEAVALFKSILKGIDSAYQDEASSDYPNAQERIAKARDTMMKFKDMAEALAANGSGIPFV